MKILDRVKETYADGPGIRYGIYVAGCENACPDCHNPESWSFNQGEEVTSELVETIIKEINSNPMITGITISGGDPMHPKNTFGLLFLLDKLASLNKNIWVYTGYTIEELLQRLPWDYSVPFCLQFIDVLVDGRYVSALRDTSTFKGSYNQRFIKAKEVINNYITTGIYRIIEEEQ